MTYKPDPDKWRILPNELGQNGQLWRTFACELSARLDNAERWIEKAVKHGKLNCGHSLKHLGLLNDNGSQCRICLEALKGEHVSD